MAFLAESLTDLHNKSTINHRPESSSKKSLETLIFYETGRFHGVTQNRTFHGKL